MEGIEMEIKQIEYFLELARFEHVSQAADYLGIAQSTLSKSLATLERDLGIQLFDRVGNRIRLNRSGEEFYQYAKDAMSLLVTAELTAKKSVYETSGNLSIICTTFAPLLMGMIRDYMELNPKVSINVIQYNHDTNSNPAAENCDFILSSRGDLGEDQGDANFWVTQKLFSEENYLVVGPGYSGFRDCVKQGNRIDLQTMKDANFITMKIGRYFNDLTYQICRDAGFFPRSYLQTDDFVVKMRAIRDGLGVAFLPECCLEEASYLCPGLRAFSIANYSTTRSIYMMRKRQRQMSETARDFWQFVLDYYGVESDGREK